MSFKLNIHNKTIDNEYYRNVLYTNTQTQLVLMNLLPNQEIGMEKHNVTQFIKVESGNGVAMINGKRYNLNNESAIIIDSGAKHNIIAGKNGMKLYTLYSPPEHDSDTKEKYKEK
jgi:mannose-6-phosphate isomerase-like protein (cupin superfamily)